MSKITRCIILSMLFGPIIFILCLGVFDKLNSKVRAEDNDIIYKSLNIKAIKHIKTGDDVITVVVFENEYFIDAVIITKVGVTKITYMEKEKGIKL